MSEIVKAKESWNVQVGIQEKTTFVQQMKSLSGAALFSDNFKLPAALNLLIAFTGLLVLYHHVPDTTAKQSYDDGGLLEEGSELHSWQPWGQDVWWNEIAGQCQITCAFRFLGEESLDSLGGKHICQTQFWQKVYGSSLKLYSLSILYSMLCACHNFEAPQNMLVAAS